jgi:hypothetical protein
MISQEEIWVKYSRALLEIDNWHLISEEQALALTLSASRGTGDPIFFKKRIEFLYRAIGMK